MVLNVLRGLFVIIVMAVVLLYIIGSEPDKGFQAIIGLSFSKVATIILGALVLAGGVVLVDIFTRHKKLSSLSGVFLGLVAGLLAAYALSFVVDVVAIYTLPHSPNADVAQAYQDMLRGLKVVIGLTTCYLGISLVLQTKDDFRFVIPYVEFAKQIRGARPLILDTSVIIDGRIIDVIETHIVQGVILVPRFVLNELQTIADSADKLKRARGRRGLEILQKIQANTAVEVHLDDTEVEGAGVDQKLISLALENRGRVVTNDYNLNKVATLRGVEVINLNDLARALRPVVLPGEPMTVRLVKPGENPVQGVGYLDDGTMVVVEDGRSHIGQTITLTVTSTLQTSAGRMIFGRFAQTVSTHDDDHRHAPPSAESQDAGDASDDADRPADRPPDRDASSSSPTSSDGAAPPAQSQPQRPSGPRSSRSGRNPRRG